MAKTCKDLFTDIECTIIGNEDEEVCGIAYKSSEVAPKDVFFCIVGLNVDGHSFAQQAIDRGASVLVVERKVYLADATDVCEVIVRDTRKAMAQASANFYEHPSLAFDLVGITGTNGKTTTTYLIDHIVKSTGKTTGVIGTVGIQIGGTWAKAEHTTPESPDLQELFSHMRREHCDVVAAEVSSHALDLERTWQTRFAVTCFTNLTQDHLDFHHTFEAYFEAKARLFSHEYPAKRVICIDDPWGRELLRRCSLAEENIISTGFESAAQIHPLSVAYTPSETTISLEVRGSRFDFSYPLVGKFNVQNIMSAFGVCLQLGIEPEAIIAALRGTPPIPGRLEHVKVANDGGRTLYVDYAHTPDALEKAIAAVRTLSKGRTLVLFGCGGNRDTSKRSIMGQVALNADYAVVTSDNPRNEDPLAIIDDILPGMKGVEGRYSIVPDRREAIAAAIALTEPGDSILIAGKGHEDYQLIGNEVLPFDDVEVAAEELTKAFG